MNANEVINALGEDGEIIATVPREEAERDNLITENVLVFVFNSLSKVWVHRRPTNSGHYPGRWDISACGGVGVAETCEQAAVRELKEETGLSNVKIYFIERFLNEFPGEKGELRRRFSNLYLGLSDELPRTTSDSLEFRCWDTNELEVHAASSAALYVPSFIGELGRAVVAYERLA